MDRNTNIIDSSRAASLSLSARRAWIEIHFMPSIGTLRSTSLSARRAWIEISDLKGNFITNEVALRKESVDRNHAEMQPLAPRSVALRKESVDRNCHGVFVSILGLWSLSARRAWIEIGAVTHMPIVIMCRSPQGERG